MKRLKLLMFILVAVMLVTLPLMTACGEEEEEVIELTYATLYPPTNPLSVADQTWIDKIERETNGRVQIEPFWGGTLITPSETVAQISEGVCDIGFVSPIYATAGFDIAKTDIMFYGISDIEIMFLIYEEVCSKFPEMDAEYADVKILATQGGSPRYLFTQKEIRTLEDVQGMDIHAVGTIGKAWERVGAQAVATPMADVYMSIEKGIIDATNSPIETLQSFSIAEVVNYCYNLTAPRPPYRARGMNWDVWNSLPKDIQRIFDDNISFWTSEITSELCKVDETAIEFAEGCGVVFVELPSEELDKFYEALREVALEEAARLDAMGLPGTDILEEIQRLREQYS
jgi:TRAP-type C4-dicarboxylate transport system substrate-binding protein